MQAKEEPLELGCCSGCVRIELAAKQEVKAMSLPTQGRYALLGVGLAQRAEQIQMHAHARGNAAFSYSEAHRIASQEFSETGRDPDVPLFTPKRVEVLAEAELPRTKDGRYAITGTGRAQRVEGLQAEAAKDGNKLAWSEAGNIVARFEEWHGLSPDRPVTFAEVQRQVRAMRGDA